MQIQYEKQPSAYLRREMEWKQYGGGGGIPCLALPTGGGRFYEWEDAGMVRALQELIEGGRITLFCADSVNGESWLGQGDARRRAGMQERWHAWLCEELAPLIARRCPDRPLLALGCDLGALQAALLALRAPERFAGCVALSGLYDAAAFWGAEGEGDDLAFRNDPMRFLPALPVGHPKLRALEQSAVWLCAGQGPDEAGPLASARALEQAMRDKGLCPHLDVWGFDVTHGWAWWQRQMPYLLTQALDALEAAKGPDAEGRALK